MQFTLFSPNPCFCLSFFEEAGKPLSSKEGALLQVLIMLISVRLELFFRITLTSINELGMSLHASTALSNKLQNKEVSSGKLSFCSKFVRISALNLICLSWHIFIYWQNI